MMTGDLFRRMGGRARGSEAIFSSPAYAPFFCVHTKKGPMDRAIHNKLIMIIIFVIDLFEGI